MKVDKQVAKKCILKIKEGAVGKGYKKINNTIYKIEKDYVISIDFLIINLKDLCYRINVKKSSFDKIFWEIMKMEDNLNKNDSLRVNGAFAAPFILIEKGKLEISNDVEMIANNFLEVIDKKLKEFFEECNIEQYISSGNTVIDINIIRCLFYIDLGNYSRAVEIAKGQISLGDAGRFENKGKGFYELVSLYNCVP